MTSAGPTFTAAALYTGEGQPFQDAPVPPLDGPDGLLRTRPVCHLLYDLDNLHACERSDVDLIYVLPIGSGPHQVASDHHAALVAVLDRGGKVALHGPDEEAVAQAIGVVLALAGGGRA